MSSGEGIPTTVLNSGTAMPRLGHGTWPMSDDDVQTVAAQAMDVGYRMFDTAEVYGNEVGLGRALRHTDVPREDLFVISKLRGRHHAYDLAIRAFHATLSRLGLQYLDLYLIHWPVPDQGLYVDAWRALVKLRDDGLVRAIGVSNFAPSHISRLAAETGIVPAVNQVQLHPGIARPDWRADNQSRGIAIQCWSPLGRARKLIEHQQVQTIADRVGCTPAQVILRWHIDLGLSPIVRSANVGRLRQNSEIFDIALEAEDLAALSALDRTESAGADPQRLQPL
ncbi:aldo/keto reductase [Catelliglobosispora koreensis]|uniref:aldo/keto reductase n=1 Tax=Catelliglobosispora koreensis TaxID=129052 RepID=UPI0003778447|nr:aldo/keto reductase [Catelliglobosispora koreensis]